MGTFAGNITTMLKHIPNALTLSNLFLGCLAILAVLYGQFQLAVWLVLGAIFADYIDGAVARMLGVSSPLGKELDSIADAVSFGVVPGVIFYQLLTMAQGQALGTICWPAIPGFLVSAAAGLRLARFNLDTRQTDSFIGLPTPSLTLFTLGLLMIYQSDFFGLKPLLEKTWVLYALVGLFSFLLNAPLPMFAMKFKSFGWKGNEIKFIFAAVAILLLAIWREAAFSVIIVLYLLVSLTLYLFQKNTRL